MSQRDDWGESRDRPYDDDQYARDRAYGDENRDERRPDEHRREHPAQREWRHRDWRPEESGRENRFGEGRYGRGRREPDRYGGDQYSRDWYGQNRYDRDRYGYERDRYREGGSSRFSQPPFAQQPSGHAPFSHSSFGESTEPRYFGTGSHGYGGGPSFTGGTYGMSDKRSDSPYFQEVGFNQGYYEDPFGSEPNEPNRYPSARASAGERPMPRRRYPMGPKGYQRSDERMCEDISERLMEAYHIDSSEVTVRVLGGKAILEGTVPDRRMKHAIEDLACAAPGIQDVENRVRVADFAGRQSQQGPGELSSPPGSAPGRGTQSPSNGTPSARQSSGAAKIHRG